MITEPELLNERLERLAMVLDEIMPNCASLVRDALELLKEKDCNCCGTVFDVAYKAGKADAVVRCKDCKWNNGYTGCDKYLLPHGGDWFCADGVKKDG